MFHYDGEVLQTVEFPDSAANVVHDVFRDEGGDIWFATDGGLIRYSPANSRPEIRISGVFADEEILGLEDVQVSGEVSHFVVQFRGRSDVDAVSQLVYRYRLEGIDTDWRQSNACRAEYSRLTGPIQKKRNLLCENELCFLVLHRPPAGTLLVLFLWA